MGLTFTLCDQLGRRIGNLPDRLESRVEPNVNGIRTATVVVSLGDEVVPIVKAMETRLKVYLGESIILNAPVFLPHHEDAGGTGVLAISATDNIPLATRFVRSMAAQVQIDQSEIMARLVEAGDSTPTEKASGIAGHGIIRGNLPASMLRDRLYYDLEPIWDSIVAYTELENGVDFELEPLDREDGVHMQLNTFHPRRGSDRTASVIFEYGCGRHNASGFSWDPSGEQLVNRFIMAGETPEGSPTTPAWVSESIESQQLFDCIYEGAEVDTDISEQTTLKAHADVVVATRAFPIDFFTITPAVEQGGTAVGWARDASGNLATLGEGYGVPPRFGPDGDYWLGDTVAAIIKRGGVEVALTGRVSSVVLSEADSAGSIVAELALTPPDKAAAVTGYATNLTLGPMDQVTDFETVDTSEPPEPDEFVFVPSPTGSKVYDINRGKKKGGKGGKGKGGGKRGGKKR